MFPTTISSYTGDVWCPEAGKEETRENLCWEPHPQNFSCAPLAKLGQMPTSHLMTGMEVGGSHCLLRPVLGPSFLRACGHWEERGQKWSLAGQKESGSCCESVAPGVGHSFYFLSFSLPSFLLPAISPSLLPSLFPSLLLFLSLSLFF